MIPDNVYFTPSMIAEASGIEYATILARIRARAAEGLIPPCSHGRGASLYTYDEVKLIIRKPAGSKQPRSGTGSNLDEMTRKFRTEILRRQLIDDGFNIRRK